MTPTLDSIMAALKRGHLNGSIGPEEYSKSVAYLERLKEPTKEMRKKLMDWLLDTDNIRQNDDGWGVIIETVIVPDFATRLLKAAEESQDE